MILKKSISFEGDSGPYLQYSFARANSSFGKRQKAENILPDFDVMPPEILKWKNYCTAFQKLSCVPPKNTNRITLRII